MTDEKDKKTTEPAGEEIRIDYENIDVADIMAQIKKKIAAQPQPPEKPDSHSWHDPGAAPMFTPESPEEEGKTGLKRIILKLHKFIK